MHARMHARECTRAHPSSRIVTEVVPCRGHLQLLVRTARGGVYLSMCVPIYDETHHFLPHTHLQFLDKSLQLTRLTTPPPTLPPTQARACIPHVRGPQGLRATWIAQSDRGSELQERAHSSNLPCLSAVSTAVTNEVRRQTTYLFTTSDSRLNR